VERVKEGRMMRVRGEGEEGKKKVGSRYMDMGKFTPNSA
jgi:hypothetical protein